MRFVVFVLALVFVTGCHTTRVSSQARASSVTHEGKQWFMFGGAARISKADGGRCENGIAFVESEMAIGDWAITAGLTLVGELLAMGLCSSVEDPWGRVMCGTALSAGLPFMVSSRSVRYACTPSSRRDGLSPDEHGAVFDVHEDAFGEDDARDVRASGRRRESYGKTGVNPARLKRREP